MTGENVYLRAAEAFAELLGPDADGWFTGTICFQLVEGKIRAVDGAMVHSGQRIPSGLSYEEAADGR